MFAFQTISFCGRDRAPKFGVPKKNKKSAPTQDTRTHTRIHTRMYKPTWLDVPPRRQVSMSDSVVEPLMLVAGSQNVHRQNHLRCSFPVSSGVDCFVSVGVVVCRSSGCVGTWWRWYLWSGNMLMSKVYVNGTKIQVFQTIFVCVTAHTVSYCMVDLCRTLELHNIEPSSFRANCLHQTNYVAFRVNKTVSGGNFGRMVLIPPAKISPRYCFTPYLSPLDRAVRADFFFTYQLSKLREKKWGSSDGSI